MKRLSFLIFLYLIPIAIFAQTLNGLFIGHNINDDVRIYKFHDSREYWTYDGEGYLLDDGKLAITNDKIQFESSHDGIESFTAKLGQENYRTLLLSISQPDGSLYIMQLYRQQHDGNSQKDYWHGDKFANHPVPELKEREILDLIAIQEEYAKERQFWGFWKFGDQVFNFTGTGKYKIADSNGVIMEEGWFDSEWGRLYFSPNKSYAPSDKEALLYDFQWLDDYTLLMLDAETNEEIGIMEKIGRRREYNNSGKGK